MLQDNETSRTNKEVESDAKKLVDKHMADRNHVITDEELASIRVGVAGEANASDSDVDESTDRIADQKSDSEKDSVPGSQKATPWDVLGE